MIAETTFPFSIDKLDFSSTLDGLGSRGTQIKKSKGSKAPSTKRTGSHLDAPILPEHSVDRYHCNLGLPSRPKAKRMNMINHFERSPGFLSDPALEASGAPAIFGTLSISSNSISARFSAREVSSAFSATICWLRGSN